MSRVLRFAVGWQCWEMLDGISLPLDFVDAGVLGVAAAVDALGSVVPAVLGVKQGVQRQRLNNLGEAFGTVLPGFRYSLIPCGECRAPLLPLSPPAVGLRAPLALRTTLLLRGRSHVLRALEGLPRAYTASPWRCHREGRALPWAGRAVVLEARFCGPVAFRRLPIQSRPSLLSRSTAAALDRPCGPAWCRARGRAAPYPSLRSGNARPALRASPLSRPHAPCRNPAVALRGAPCAAITGTAPDGQIINERKADHDHANHQHH